MATKQKRDVSERFANKAKGKSNLPKGASVKTERGGSPENIKTSMQSGSSRLFTMKDGDTTIIAFLEEPQEWLRFSQHRSEKTKSSVPCIGDQCEFCKRGNRASKRAFINIFDRKAKKVKLFIANTDVVGDLLSKFSKRGTLVDRFYTISREGELTETKYHIEREDIKIPNRIKGLEKLDGMVELNSWLNNYYGTDDEEEEFDDEEVDDEEEEVEEDDEEEEDDSDILPPKKAKAKTSKISKKRSRK